MTPPLSLYLALSSSHIMNNREQVVSLSVQQCVYVFKDFSMEDSVNLISLNSEMGHSLILTPILPCCVHCKPSKLNTSTCMAYVVRIESEVISVSPCHMQLSVSPTCSLPNFVAYIYAILILSHNPHLLLLCFCVCSPLAVPPAHFPHPPTPGGEYSDGVPVLNCSGTFLQDDERYQHSHQHSQ